MTKLAAKARLTPKTPKLGYRAFYPKTMDWDDHDKQRMETKRIQKMYGEN